MADFFRGFIDKVRTALPLGVVWQWWCVSALCATCGLMLCLLQFAYDDGVLVLEDGNFVEGLAKWGSLLIEFYAPVCATARCCCLLVSLWVGVCGCVCEFGLKQPVALTGALDVCQWCGHCKQLAPKYVEAAKQLKAFDSSMAIAKVDATENKILAKDFDVTSFPTLKFVCGKNRRSYPGARETAYVKRVAQCECVQLTAWYHAPRSDFAICTAPRLACHCWMRACVPLRAGTLWNS